MRIRRPNSPIRDPSLVLYLPLYQLDGNAFMDKSAYGHLCQNTGALWTPWGRSFYGTDDKVNCGASSVLSFGNGSTDSPFTFNIWVKMTDATSFFPFSKGVAASYEYNLETDVDDKLTIKLYNSGATALIGRIYNTALTAYENTWIMLTATYDGTKTSAGIRLYLNANRVDDTDNNSGTYPAMTAGTAPFLVASVWNANFSGCLIGELLGYNRALTALEIQRNYLSTKWRYS